MNAQAYLFAAALLLVPVSASAQTADCKAALDQVTSQLEGLSTTANNHTKIGVSAVLSGRGMTWNRMATATQDPHSASLVPADRGPGGAEGLLPQAKAKPAKPGGVDPAIKLALAQSAWQTALADHTRGNEAGCQRQLAYATSELKSIKG